MEREHRVREVCGIPLWLLEVYLQELGGKKTAPGLIVGNGWQAQLAQMEDFRVGSLSVGQVMITIDGTPKSLEELEPGLEKKLLRAGG